MVVLGFQASSRQREYPHAAKLRALLDENGYEWVEIGRKEWYGRLYPHATECKIDEIPHIIEQGDLIIAVDSGILAIALALGKPTIGLFGPTSEKIIAEQFRHFHPDLQLKVIRSDKPDSCQRPCNFHDKRGYGINGKCTRIPIAKCMTEIEPETILSQIKQIIHDCSRNL